MTFLFKYDLHLVNNKNTLKQHQQNKNRKQQKDENANKEWQNDNKQ